MPASARHSWPSWDEVASLTWCDRAATKLWARPCTHASRHAGLQVRTVQHAGVTGRCHSLLAAVTLQYQPREVWHGFQLASPGPVCFQHRLDGTERSFTGTARHGSETHSFFRLGRLVVQAGRQCGRDRGQTKISQTVRDDQATEPVQSPRWFGCEGRGMARHGYLI